MSTKRSLSLQIEEFVHRQSSQKPLKRAPRPTKHQMRQWVAEDPDSLQARLAVSPYGKNCQDEKCTLLTQLFFSF
jgi:hypothetical protein